MGYAYPAGAEPADRELTALPSTTMPFGNSDPFGNSTLVESGYSAIRRQLKGGGGAGAAFVGERKLVNPKFGSFDDFSSAMLLLFQMSTGDDWDTVMFWAMDSVGPGEPRKRNDSSGACLYFVSWMFVGCFFAMQLFVGVVVDQFNTIRSEKDGSAHMTESQKQWVETMKSMQGNTIKMKPQYNNGGEYDLILFDVCRSKAFDTGFQILVACNMLVLCSDFWGYAQGWRRPSSIMRPINSSLTSSTFASIWRPHASYAPSARPSTQGMIGAASKD